MFPLAEMVRRQNKLVLPVFVRPSFERHEVDKRRYDHALHVGGQFDKARIRLIEIMNDHGYSDRDPQPQSVVWERMNLPIARGLRGLIYVLWDLSQVDPSDLSILLAGNGRMRIGFGEINPPEGHDPTDTQVREAVDGCWQNPYCVFSKVTGTSLVCIHGDWSNMADAKIKSGIAARALAVPDARYNPLYARAVQTPKPWGVTALFTEYTGAHEPTPLTWNSTPSLPSLRPSTSDTLVDRTAGTATIVSEPAVTATRPFPRSAIKAAGHIERTPGPSFATVGDFAKALNRLDPIALELASGEPRPDIPIEGPAVKKLISVFWFKSIFPRLSASWRERLLDALASSTVIPNHVLSLERHSVHLADGSYEDLKEISAKTAVSGAAGTDLQLVLAIMRLWGEEARRRLRFVEVAAPDSSSRLGALFGLRRSP
jgi:hypothetical protein